MRAPTPIWMPGCRPLNLRRGSGSRFASPAGSRRTMRLAALARLLLHAAAATRAIGPLRLRQRRKEAARLIKVCPWIRMASQPLEDGSNRDTIGFQVITLD